MKIKKIFSIASVCSLAILMTACSSKNSSIMSKDILDYDTITLDEYQKEIATKKNVESVFKDKSIQNYNGGIVIAYDTDYYYVYNLSLEEKQILKIAYDKVYTINIDTQSKAVIVSYVKGDETYYGYVIS